MATGKIRTDPAPEEKTAGEKPRIALGADHAGFRVKDAIKKYLQDGDYEIDDVGTWSEESVDYPDFAAAVAGRVAGGQSRFRHSRLRHGDRHVHRRK